MRTPVLLGAAVLSIGLVVPMAAAETESQTLDFSFPLSPNMAILEFDQFDDMGGTRELKKVIINFNGNMGANVTAENDSSLPAPDFAVGIAGFLTFDIGAETLFVGLDETFASGGVEASDGVPGSGPDFHDFGFVETGDNDSVSVDTDLAAYIGGGTIEGVVFASGGFSITGTTDATLNVTGFMGWGDAEIIYEYNIIPAPGALALLGLGLAGARRRRRA